MDQIANEIRRINIALTDRNLPLDQRELLQRQRQMYLRRYNRVREENEMPALISNYDPDEKRRGTSRAR